MEKSSLFIVIEGLDGSGKTSAAKQLAHDLDQFFAGKTKFTFEPNNDSCGGEFIRQVLRKEITISPRTLALAYAANRADHCDRVVVPWLENGGIVVCDRFYLSSLVYNSADDFQFDKVLFINEKARKPDLIFFLEVDDKICYARMKNRNQPPELFEKNLAATRKKYHEAIDFLTKNHGDLVVEIDGSGTVQEVADAMLEKIFEYFPAWKT